MKDCIFCKIADKEFETSFVYDHDGILAFHDIKPQAPTHILIIPQKHIATLNDLSEHDVNLMGRMTQVAQEIAKKLNHNEDGYRLIMNCNPHGGQTVYHIHMHLLAGRQMEWPPG